MEAQATEYFLVVTKDEHLYAVSFEAGTEPLFLEYLVSCAESPKINLTPQDVLDVLDEVEAFLTAPGGPPIVRTPARTY